MDGAQTYTGNSCMLYIHLTYSLKVILNNISITPASHEVKCGIYHLSHPFALKKF
jgi:hypothetical protein